MAAARFSDPAATEYLGEMLIKRRNQIGRAWLTGVNPIVSPSIDPQHPSWSRPVRSYFRRGTGNTWTLVGFERLHAEK